jgi:hypothetical protein
MQNTLPIIFSILLITLVVLMCRQESQRRCIHFFVALLLCVCLTPVIAYYIIIHRPLRAKRFCWHCNNTESEKIKCGVCGHNTDDVNLNQVTK